MDLKYIIAHCLLFFELHAQAQLPWFNSYFSCKEKTHSKKQHSASVFPRAEVLEGSVLPVLFCPAIWFFFSNGLSWWHTSLRNLERTVSCFGGKTVAIYKQTHRCTLGWQLLSLYYLQFPCSRDGVYWLIGSMLDGKLESAQLCKKRHTKEHANTDQTWEHSAWEQFPGILRRYQKWQRLQWHLHFKDDISPILYISY